MSMLRHGVVTVLLIISAFPRATPTESTSSSATLGKLRTIEGPGVTLHKTYGPVDAGILPTDFPGTLPVSFIREALGIEVLNTAGFERLRNDTKKCIVLAAADGGADDESCKGDVESQDESHHFGQMMLARAREMFQQEECEHELDEFLSTGLSNEGSRTMHWVSLDIHPNRSFALHSHPNIEFVYIVEGTLWEWRLVDRSVEKKKRYDPEEVIIDGEIHLRYVGPNLTSVDALGGTFEKKAYKEGEMFINTIGAVHQSFTQSEGAKLFAIWGDGNADVPLKQLPQNSEYFNDQSAKAWD